MPAPGKNMIAKYPNYYCPDIFWCENAILFRFFSCIIKRNNFQEIKLWSD